jgi:hypothetical protein
VIKHKKLVSDLSWHQTYVSSVLRQGPRVEPPRCCQCQSGSRW